MKLYFIRHGQTDWNVAKKIQGSCDIPLNATGIKQAEKLGEDLIQSSYNISKIYTSPKQRAIKTAEILSKAMGIKYIISEGLEEINFGKWEGLSWDEVKSTYPKEYEYWHMHRETTVPPGGESYNSMMKRILSTLQDIINSNSHDVAIITHNAVIMSLQCHLTSTPFHEMLKFRSSNTSILELDSDSFEKLEKESYLLINKE